MKAKPTFVPKWQKKKDLAQLCYRVFFTANVKLILLESLNLGATLHQFLQTVFLSSPLGFHEEAIQTNLLLEIP